MIMVMEGLKGWRTVLVNLLMGIVPLMEMSEIIPILPDEWEPFYIFGIALINMWLRAMTDTKIGQKR
ncbi:MAG: hypothetical protein PSN37_04865 [Alphaproteobacteria bacterium]|nr:hypothetical protein [Alphaproteobacteria bacterium]